MRHRALSPHRPATRRARRELARIHTALSGAGRALGVGVGSAASCHAPALPTPTPAWLSALAQLAPGDRCTVIVHEHGTAAVVIRAGFHRIGADAPSGHAAAGLPPVVTPDGGRVA